MAAILDRIRASPVVHADETGWRQSANGYVWTFSTPTERYFLRRGRGKTVVDEALSDAFSGVLVSDFYAAYHHYDGPKQRCWAHLLRDIHDLNPLPQGRRSWPGGPVHQLWMLAAKGATACCPLESGSPFLEDPVGCPGHCAGASKRHIKELFVFVAEPDAPADNNPAESEPAAIWLSAAKHGTESKMALASLFGTWRAQGLNPLAACRQLLVSPLL